MLEIAIAYSLKGISILDNDFSYPAKPIGTITIVKDFLPPVNQLAIATDKRDRLFPQIK
jgi:hypothetical protein